MYLQYLHMNIGKKNNHYANASKYKGIPQY